MKNVMHKNNVKYTWNAQYFCTFLKPIIHNSKNLRHDILNFLFFNANAHCVIKTIQKHDRVTFGFPNNSQKFEKIRANELQLIVVVHELKKNVCSLFENIEENLLFSCLHI